MAGSDTDDSYGSHQRNYKICSRVAMPVFGLAEHLGLRGSADG